MFLPGVPDATGRRSQPHTKGPRGKRGNRCPFATEGTTETGSWGQSRTCYHGQGSRSPAAGTQRQSCARRRDRGSRCSVPAGAAQAPRKEAATGSRGERRGQAPQAPSVLQVPCVSAFPFLYSVKMFEVFFEAKQNKTTHAWSTCVVPPGLPPAHIICLYSPLISASYIMAFEHMSI